MTEKLKTLMDDAADAAGVDFVSPDLDAIYRNGDRTVRRRRLTEGAAGLAAAAVVAGGVLVATGLGPDTGADVANSPTPPAEWALGSVLHTASGPIDVGRPVRAYVQTSIGYVVVDDAGTVWSVVGTEVSRVGVTTTDGPRLVGDDDAPMAAWVDTSHAPLVVAYDQERNQTIALETTPRDEVAAVDSGTVYVRAGLQFRAMTIDGPSTQLDPPSAHSDLLDVEEGVLVWSDPGRNGGRSDYVIVRREMEPVVIPLVQGEMAFLSPDARWVTFDADEPRVFDTQTGERANIDTAGRAFASAYGWVDDTALAMVASRSEFGEIELLVCEVPAGACVVDEASSGELGTFADVIGSDLALPFGIAIED